MSSLQPGSSIKPVVVYPYAIDNKMLYFSSQIEDAPLEKYETNEYGELVSGPKNWYAGYKGTMLYLTLSKFLQTVQPHRL